MQDHEERRGAEAAAARATQHARLRYDRPPYVPATGGGDGEAGGDDARWYTPEGRDAAYRLQRRAGHLWPAAEGSAWRLLASWWLVEPLWALRRWLRRALRRAHPSVSHPPRRKP